MPRRHSGALAQARQCRRNRRSRGIGTDLPPAIYLLGILFIERRHSWPCPPTNCWRFPRPATRGPTRRYRRPPCGRGQRRPAPPASHSRTRTARSRRRHMAGGWRRPRGVVGPRRATAQDDQQQRHERTAMVRPLHTHKIWSGVGCEGWGQSPPPGSHLRVRRRVVVRGRTRWRDRPTTTTTSAGAWSARRAAPHGATCSKEPTYVAIHPPGDPGAV